MKKLAALLLLLVLLAVLGACGGAETTEEFNLPTTDWVEIYRGSILTLNPDRTMTLGDAKGTWKMEDNCVTLTYRTANGKIVRCAELMEENGFTLLRADTTGTITGQQRFFSESDYYPADQIDEAKKVVDLEAENDPPAEEPEKEPEEEHPPMSYDEWKSDSSNFTNAYGTAGTTCAESGCDKPIVTSGDSNCCATHSNRCGECSKYIDGDAMFCMDCLREALS